MRKKRSLSQQQGQIEKSKLVKRYYKRPYSFKSHKLKYLGDTITSSTNMVQRIAIKNNVLFAAILTRKD